MKIRLELDDNRTFAAEANMRTFMGLASRIAFEHEFGISPAAMRGWQGLYGEDGEPREDADLSVLREEWLAFFMWHELKRQDADTPAWSEVIEHVVAIDAEGDNENPTAGESV